MNELDVKRDLAASVKAAALLWILPVATILMTGHFADFRWIITTGWTVSLLVMGSACLINARGCGRMHCYFTGPFFLLMAGVSLLHGLQLLSFGRHGWHTIGNILMVGGVLLCVIPELLWGRYRRCD